MWRKKEIWRFQDLHLTICVCLRHSNVLELQDVWEWVCLLTTQVLVIHLGSPLTQSYNNHKSCSSAQLKMWGMKAKEDKKCKYSLSEWGASSCDTLHLKSTKRLPSRKLRSTERSNKFHNRKNANSRTICEVRPSRNRIMGLKFSYSLFSSPLRIHVKFLFYARSQIQPRFIKLQPNAVVGLIEVKHDAMRDRTRRWHSQRSAESGLIA